MSKEPFTPKQQNIIRELCEAHGLDEKQIGFEGDSNNPIFDYSAMNLLRLRLTDLQDVETSIVERTAVLVTAKSTVTLADGRKAGDLGTAEFGETMFDGNKVANMMQVQNLALSRAFRRGLTAAGINLYKCHLVFMETGEVATGEPVNLRRKYEKEIHNFADEFGHDDNEYRQFLQNIFGVRTSKDLNENKLHQLADTYRLMVNAKRRASKLAA
jgi:hypothetical protein